MSTTPPVSRLDRLRSSDDGIGLVEVIVALMIFSIIAVGMAYSLASMSRLTAESSARETASNLAAAEIDRVQAVPDAFSVYSTTTTTPPIDGIPFTVKTSVGWVSTNGATGSCGSGGGNLQYKRVNVTVTWPGMYLSRPVRADSVLAPDSRINDPSYGTVLISVLGVDGTGRSSVTVRVTPESGGGGTTITDTIDPTDVDGCSYIFKVAPGKYRIEVERSGFVDVNQNTVPAYTQQVVVAGATLTASFQYDNAGSFTLAYAANSTASPDLPSNLDTTFIGGVANYRATSPSSPIRLHPYPSGYQAVAGDADGCLATDPAKWAENATLAAGVRPDAVAAAPGGSATIAVPMGVVSVQIPNSNLRRYITAVQQSAPGDGNPGCATLKTYTFTRQWSKNSTATIALPYGTWLIYTGNSVGSTSMLMDSSAVTPLDSVIELLPGGVGGVLTGVLGGGSVAGSVVTLDPRAPK